MAKFVRYALVAALTMAATPLIMTAPAAAQGIVHNAFMRGQVVDMTGGVATICIGKADGATAGQTLTVFKVSSSMGPSRGTTPGSLVFKRTETGTIRITSVIDDHFAQASVASGEVAKNDVVELRRH